MPETVIAWKLVALIISGRKSAERSLSNIIYELKPLIPGVRIDTEVFSGNPDDSYLDTAFKKASTADIVIGVIDEHFSRVAIQSRIVPVDITLSANKLFNYMSLDKAIPKILFIRYSPDNPDESFRSTIDSLIDFYDGNYRRVKSNKDFERNLYSLLWDHLGRFQDRPDLLLPVQGAGPHFGISPSGQIASTSPRDIDQSGNDLRRIDQLLPLLKECADDFLANSGSIGNQHPSLVRDMSRYRQIISVNEEAIDWGLLWGVGVKLESSAAAVERRVADRLAPELEDEPLAALQSLRSLHAPLILATAEGRELQEQADRIRMTKGEQATLRDAAVAFSEGLKQHEEIIEIEAATIVAEAAETVGAEPHPERGTTYGIIPIAESSDLSVDGSPS